MQQIIVYFDCGLGNQMSQYAMYKLLSNLYPKKKIYANIDAYKNYTVHNGFELKKVFPNVELRFSTKLNAVLGYHSQQIVQKYESGYPMDKRIFSLGKSSYKLIGTWHNYDYSSIMPELQKDFQFPELPAELKVLGEEISSCNSASIHVRKGDYIEYGLDILNLDWYKKAIDIIKSKIENPTFYVFSDEDVKSEFDKIDCNFHYVTGNTGENAYRDMQLMSMCKHNIIANSTFSYWATLLNKNPDKIVIRPCMQTKTNKTWKVDGWILL